MRIIQCDHCGCRTFSDLRNKDEIRDVSVLIRYGAYGEPVELIHGDLCKSCISTVQEKVKEIMSGKNHSTV